MTCVRSGLALVAAPVLLLVGALADFLRLVGPLRPQIDDAYISYRYAANWVAGHGLVWNPGEWVEGFSNPLWTLAVAGAMQLGAEPRAFGHALGLAGGIGVGIATWLFARELLPPPHRWLAALAVWPVSASVALVHWSTAGLETSVFVALEVAALASFAAGRMGWSVAFLLLGTATRLDGVLLAGVLLGFPLARRWRQAGGAAWRPALVYAALLAASFVLRFACYGSLLPNTWHAKVGGVPLGYGLTYLSAFLTAGALWLLPPAALALVRERRVWPAAAFCLCVVLYVLWIGGDAFPHSRFLLPVLPVLAALAVVGVSSAFRLRPAFGFALAPCLLLAVCAQIWGTPSALIAQPGASLREQSLQREWNLAAHGEAVQQQRVARLEARERPRLVAAGAIGAFGYFSQLPVLDILGLVDAHIARARVAPSAHGLPIPGHSRSDADYVFSRQPDYILIPRRHSLDSWVYAIQDLWAHPELERHYVWDEEIEGYRRRADSGATSERGK